MSFTETGGNLGQAFWPRVVHMSTWAPLSLGPYQPKHAGGVCYLSKRVSHICAFIFQMYTDDI